MYNIFMRKRIVLVMIYLLLFGCLVFVIVTNDPAFVRRAGLSGLNPPITEYHYVMLNIPTSLPTKSTTPVPDNPTPTISPMVSVAPLGVVSTSPPAQTTQAVGTPMANDALSMLINEKRSLNRLSLYSSSEVSCEIADRRVVETLSNYSHTGLSYYVDLYDIGVGENLADRYPTNEAVINAWMNSPSHRANILSTTWQYSCVRMVGSHIVVIFTT